MCAARGDCALLDFLSPGLGDQVAGDKRRMMAFLDWVAHQPNGPPKNPEVSHQVDSGHGIWQFTKGRIRVLWFYDEGRVIVLSHGFVKATRQTPSEEIGRAVAAVTAYFQAKRTGKLRFIEDT